ncbi:MAG: class I SAM-dependent methyltransferase [Chloroflexota bacterium]
MGAHDEIPPYLSVNRAWWDERAPLHAGPSSAYDLDAFRRHPDRLGAIERDEVGDVAGRTLLHLQCHIGTDTLSWATRGATVTGVDFSPPALEIARGLARDLGIDDRARFVESDVYRLPEVLEGEFDVVFASWGAINWLPDVERWFRVAAHFVAPGGFAYLADGHPTAWVFNDDASTPPDLRVTYPYFTTVEPIDYLGPEETGSYAVPEAPTAHNDTHEWAHPLGAVVQAAIDAGLTIELLHEHAAVPWRMFPFLVAGDDGLYRLPDGTPSFPLAFSLRARKPGA